MSESFDVIIIGAGHNGLVAAAYLARAGRRVLVLESRELVGGCAVTEPLWPGYWVSTAAYLSSLMQPQVAVSYTHLDVYKRQLPVRSASSAARFRLARRQPSPFQNIP